MLLASQTLSVSELNGVLDHNKEDLNTQIDAL
jgi:hypothetical protein